MKDKYNRLHVDIPGSIVELQAVLKEFKLKRDIWRILFRGKGLEFDGYRNFSPDDDAQEIDWKASSRTQKLLVKKYKEERDMKIMFIIDASTNMILGSTEKLKCEYSAELIAAFSSVLIGHNDRIGFLFFADKINPYIEFKSGSKHLDLFIDFLSRSENYGGQQDLNAALDFALEFLDSSVLAVIIVSDFLGADKLTEKKINLLSYKFETIALKVNDPLDFYFPNVEGEFTLEDPETHEQIIVNPRIIKSSYDKSVLGHEKFVRALFKRTAIDYLQLTTDKPFAVPLAGFIKERLLYKI